jgi:hypothetical protein
MDEQDHEAEEHTLAFETKARSETDKAMKDWKKLTDAEKEKIYHLWEETAGRRWLAEFSQLSPDELFDTLGGVELPARIIKERKNTGSETLTQEEAEIILDGLELVEEAYEQSVESLFDEGEQQKRFGRAVDALQKIAGGHR